MRPVTLAKVAAQAEILLLRRMARRQVMRAVYGAVAAVFGIGVLVLLHVVAYHAMVPGLSPLLASIIILVADLVIAWVLAFLGSRDAPDDIEIQAREILRMRDLLEKMLADHSGKTVEEIRKDIERDKILTAQEAVEYGLVDEVVSTRKAAALSAAGR